MQSLTACCLGVQPFGSGYIGFWDLDNILGLVFGVFGISEVLRSGISAVGLVFGRLGLSFPTWDIRGSLSMLGRRMHVVQLLSSMQGTVGCTTTESFSRHCVRAVH